MVKNIIFCIALFFIFSCTVKKNEYGQPRFNESRFSLKMKKGEEVKIKNIISLDCIYRLDKVINIHFNEEVIDFKEKYLKFYENGKVAVFSTETIFEMNPKKANMGIYEYKNNKLYYEYFSHSPQAGYFKFTHELWVDNNKLFDKFGNTIRVFTKINLEPTSNKVIPDW